MYVIDALRFDICSIVNFAVIRVVLLALNVLYATCNDILSFKQRSIKPKGVRALSG